MDESSEVYFRDPLTLVNHVSQVFELKPKDIYTLGLDPYSWYLHSNYAINSIKKICSLLSLWKFNL